MTHEQRARAWYPNAAWGGGNNKPVFDGVGGRFLWKPKSDSNGKAAVHTPAGVRIASLTVAGKTYGVGSIGNGYRPLFRLDKPGSAYGSQVPVQMNLHGGSAITVIVPNGGQRFEKSGFRDTDEAPAPSPAHPTPTPSEPLFRVSGSSLVFSARAAPYIEQVFVVSMVNAKGQAGGLHRCQKVNAVTWAASAHLSQYTQPAFYAVDVVNRIEHLIPHSVRGWVYVNGKGEIVQFGQRPLPPTMPRVPPTPAPEPSKGLAAVFAGVKYADILGGGIRPVTQPDRIDFFTRDASAPEGLRKIGKLTRSADGTWKTPRPVIPDADIFELISAAHPKTRPFYSNGNLQIWANGSFRVPGSSKPANK